MEEQKKKPRTSSAVKNRYNAKTYKKFQTHAKPELYQRIEQYIKRVGISKSQFLELAIDALNNIEEKESKK